MMKRPCNAKKGATERRVYVISMDSAHVCRSKMNVGPVWWDYFSNINESFLIQDGTGLCLVNIKVHIFRLHTCLPSFIASRCCEKRPSSFLFENFLLLLYIFGLTTFRRETILKILLLGRLETKL